MYPPFKGFLLYHNAQYLFGFCCAAVLIGIIILFGKKIITIVKQFRNYSNLTRIAALLLTLGVAGVCQLAFASEHYRRFHRTFGRPDYYCAL